MKKTNNNIYVDLDSLFDLRLGLLNLINVDFAVSVTKSATYFNRLNDSFYSNETVDKDRTFGRLDQNLFKQLYSSFDKKKLVENSFYTKIPIFVMDLAKSHLANLVKQGIDSSIEIHYNIYPLVIKEENRLVIEESLYKLTESKFKIKVISLDFNNTSVADIIKEYFAIIKYDYVDWFNSKEKEIKQTAIVDSCLYVPRLFMGDIESEQTKQAFEEYTRLGGREDSFSLMSKAMSAFFPIQFVPVSAFSIGLPTNPFKLGKE